MTDEEAKEALDQLDALISKAQADGDGMAEADARARKAAVYTQKADWAPGIEELKAASRLAKGAGKVDEYCQYLYGLGLLLARIEERKGEAEQIWRHAAAAADLAERKDIRLKAQQRIVGLYAERQDWMQAIAELSVAVGWLEAEDPSDDLVQSLRLRAMLHQARGRYDRGLHDLEQAVVVAKATGDARLALQVRLERRVLRAYIQTDREPEPFTALLDEAVSLDDKALIGDMRFEQATQAIRDGELDQALVYAEGARQSALAAPDPLRYLLACMVIAEAREKMDDRAGVLAILLTCKATLEDYLGEPAGQQIKLILDSLARDDRWGMQGVQEALVEYRARMADKVPQA